MGGAFFKSIYATRAARSEHPSNPAASISTSPYFRIEARLSPGATRARRAVRAGQRSGAPPEPVDARSGWIPGPDRAADRLEHVVQAGAEVFARRGYRRTQMADVAAAMGVSPGNLYNYVDSTLA